MDGSSLRSLVDDMDLDELDLKKLNEYAESFDGRTRDILSTLEIG